MSLLPIIDYNNQYWIGKITSLHPLTLLKLIVAKSMIDANLRNGIVWSYIIIRSLQLIPRRGWVWPITLSVGSLLAGSEVAKAVIQDGMGRGTLAAIVGAIVQFHLGEGEGYEVVVGRSEGSTYSVVELCGVDSQLRGDEAIRQEVRAAALPAFK